MTAPGPLVEVVVFAYNHGPFIERALQSVLAQRTTFPIALRIHDDVSTDDTAKVIERTLRESTVPWTVTRPEENQFSQGLGFYHRFVAGSTAPFVAILDGDDFWLDEEKLQRQCEALQGSPSAALCHHPVLEFIDDALQPTDWPPTPFRTEVLPGSELSALNPIATTSVMLRRSCFPDSMPPGFERLEIADYPLWAFTTAGHDILYLDRPMSAYRMHHSSVYAALPQRKRALREFAARLYITENIGAPWRPAWREGLLAAIDYCLGETARQADLAAALRADRDRLIDELAAETAHAEQVDDERAEAVAERDRLRDSTSWRITAPLRAVGRFRGGPRGD